MINSNIGKAEQSCTLGLGTNSNLRRIQAGDGGHCLIVKMACMDKWQNNNEIISYRQQFYLLYLIGSLARDFHIGFDPDYELIKTPRPYRSFAPDDRIV